MTIYFAILKRSDALVIFRWCQSLIVLIYLAKKEFFGFPVRDISYALLFGLILYIAMINLKLQSLNDKYKWIRREWRLLDALIKDVEFLSKSMDETDKKALKRWDSEPSTGVTGRLQKVDKALVETIKRVVRDARGCVESYERRSGGIRKFPMSPYSISRDWVAISNLEFEIDLIKVEIDNLITKNAESFEDIYRSLERSRSILRILQDRPLEEDKSPFQRAIQSLVFEDSQKEIDYSIKMPMQQLLAFLEDLEGLKFENEMEEAWVKEAEQIIEEFHEHINSPVRKVNPMTWLSRVGNLMASHKHSNCCSCMECLLHDLFERKAMFGFTFTRRNPPSSNSILQYFPLQRNDDVGILPLLDNIRKLLNQEQAKVYFSSIHNHFEKVYKLLMDTKAVEGIKHSRMAWMDQLKNIVIDAENFLRALYRQRSPCQTSNDPKETDPWLKYSAEVCRFERALSFLELSIKVCRIEQREESNLVVGLEDDTQKVVSRLTSNSEDHFTLSIVGMKGIGKTTLAKTIYNHRDIRGLFKVRYWVSLPDTVPKDKELLQIVGNQVLGNNEERNEREYWIKKVHDCLNKEKLILVLDNISSTDDWKALKAVLPDTKNGSRVLLTTRHKTVASHADQSGVPHQLRLRTREESWRLFIQMVQFQPEQPSKLELSPPELSQEVAKELSPEVYITEELKTSTKECSPPELSHHVEINKLKTLTKELSSSKFSQEAEIKKMKTLANKVVGRCGGLPLSILRLGYLMSGKKVTLDELSSLELVNDSLAPWKENLYIINKDLPSHLRQCFSFFGHLLSDSEIPARRLAALWVAAGLVMHNGNEQEPLENVAEKYMSELIDRNLMQVVEQKLNGKLKTCGFPFALLEVLRDKNSKMDPSCYPISSFDQQLVCHFDERYATYSDNHRSSIISPDIWRRYRNLRSFVFFDTGKRYKSGANIGNFLVRGIASGHLLQLQILDLQHVFRPQLPNTIGNLIHLTYLGLRWTYLETIPSSIGKLTSLETLDMKHTYILTLPSSIWKLQKLKHLYMNEIHRSKFVHRPRGTFLQNLQTLQNAYIDKQSPLKDYLYKLTSLRKLALTFQLKLSQQKALEKSLVLLKKLQSLKLKSIDEMGNPQSLEVECLSSFENLSSLYLFGILEKPSIIIDINKLPQNLTNLTFSATRLLNDPMKELEKLCNLKSLSFYSYSYTGKSLVCSKGGFPQLLVLKFWVLCELEEWNLEEEAMPNLKQLEIRSCKRLKVPTGLRHLRTLRELKLKDMPKEFTATIEETISKKIEEETISKKIEEETKEQIWGSVSDYPATVIDVQ